MSSLAASASFSSRSSSGSLNTRHQSLYAIGVVALAWVVGAADSLNCVGTGADGRWYFGPTAQLESDIPMTSAIAAARDRGAKIRRRVMAKVIDTDLVRSMFVPTFRPSARPARLLSSHRQDSPGDLRSPRPAGLFR